MRSGCRFLQSRTPEYDDGRADPLFTLNQLGFQEFESDAYGAEFFPLEKFRIAISGNVGRVVPWRLVHKPGL